MLGGGVWERIGISLSIEMFTTALYLSQLTLTWSSINNKSNTEMLSLEAAGYGVSRDLVKTVCKMCLDWKSIAKIIEVSLKFYYSNSL